MTMTPVAVGLVGCGAVSEFYFKNAAKFAPYFKIVACADLDPGRAQKMAKKCKAAACGTVQELLDDPQVELVLNLTVPLAHADVSRDALDSGKHLYSEKPLATDLTEARRLVHRAAVKELRIGCAPDTFLGGSQQGAREVIDSAALGNIIGGCAFMMTAGVETWHPNPAFFYKAGGGPLFDMGPYYLATLINLLGPVRRVTASAQTHIPTRTITSKPHRGEKIEVEVPTHVAAILDFENGATITLTTSFEVQASSLPPIELYGTAGSIQVPDPNYFGGNIMMKTSGARWWKKFRHGRAYTNEHRGVGLADMAHAIRTGRPHRANGELALHIVEIIEGIHISSLEGRHIDITSTPERPEPFPQKLEDWQVD